MSVTRKMDINESAHHVAVTRDYITYAYRMKHVHNAYMFDDTSNLTYENEVLNLRKPCTNA